jgi:high affinity sulfate transporter 1
VSEIGNANARGWTMRLARFAPGLPALLNYKRGDFPHDLVAGLSVAAVALPVGVAYAQLAGFNPAVGLYASILPLVAYALFGTSRQLIMGPDAATCAIVAAAVAPLAGGDPQLYLSLSVALALLAGLFCIGASFLKLGALADFLSKPILVGFLNGVALSIVLGQMGKIFGFSLETGGILPRLFEFASKLGLTHWPTLAVGAVTFLVLMISPRLLPRLPAALVAMAVAVLAVKLFGLDALGVKTVGEVPAGLPALRFPSVPTGLLPELLAEAAGLALVSFSSMMLTARSFASKNRYDIDSDREFAALGAANIAAAVSQGFAVSGADSRTAMNDTAGGRTQVAGLVAAAAIAAVLLFFTGPLRYLPIAALGAVLVKAAVSLVDHSNLRLLYRIDRREFALSLLATIGVVAVGAVPAILFAVTLALLRFVHLVSRPAAEVLGKVEGLSGWHSVERHPGAATVPGVLLFRFNAPIVFFNAPQFKREVLAAAEAAGPGLRWFVLDMIPVTLIDATGLYTATELVATLRARGVTFAVAGRLTEWDLWAAKRDWKPGSGGEFLRFPTMDAAVGAYRRNARSPADPAAA